MPKTYPLYSNIETDYLHRLHEYKYLVDVIGLDTIRMVANSLNYARKKHPHFADIMTDGTLEKCREALKENRHSNDINENLGLQVADEILNEEYLEAMEQHLLGNKEKCIEELCHTAAVVFRMIELERKKMENK